MRQLWKGIIPISLLLLVLAAVPLFGQGTGAISGTVKDESGAVVPGVEITARNQGTNAVKTTVSNDSGSYRFPSLAVGVYEMTAELTGFKRVVVPNLQLTVGITLTQDFTLQLGEISEVLTVSTQASTVETEDSQISSLVNEKQVLDLPLNGRNVFTLATLQAGVVPAMGAVAQTGGPNSSSFLAAGTRARGNNFSLDGGHNTNDGISGLPVVNPSVDTVQEFRLIRNNFSAEYGTHSGSVVSVVTKSGTNSFHGSVYEFHRNDAVDAHSVFDRFDPATGQKTDSPLIQNQFGFSFGGPIVKDRVFFFGSYEGFRNREGSATPTQVETPEFRNFVIQNFPNTAAAQIFQQFPAAAPNRAVQTVGDIRAGGGTICYLCDLSIYPDSLPVRGIADSAVSNPTDSDQFNIRIDSNFNEGNTTLFGRFTIDTGSAKFPFAARPGFDDNNENRQEQVNISLAHTFSPRLINEFRFTYLYGRSDFFPDNPQVPDVFIVGAPAGISGTIGGFLGEPQLFTRDTFQWQDIISFNVGDHYFRAGVDLREAREDSDFGNTSRPLVFYRGLFDFAIDAPYYYSAGINPQTGEIAGTPRNFRSTEFGWFIQDDWKVSDRLTLNLGIRWDYFGPTEEDNGLLSSIRFSNDPNFFERVRTAVVGPVDTLYERDLNNFAPRLGFAYDLFGNGNTSLRGGYGISYDKIFFNVGANSRFNPPFFGLAAFSNVFFGDDLSGLPLLGNDPNDLFGGFLGIPVAPAFGFDEFGGVLGQRLNLRVLDPGIRDSYVHSTFLGIQHALPWDQVFEVNYQGTFGHKLGFIGDPNRFVGDRLGVASPLGLFEGDNRANLIHQSFRSFNLRENRINSNYHGVNFQLTKRFSSGIAYQLAYTYGRSLDFNSDVFGGTTDIFGLDANNIRLDYGRSDTDITQRFVTNVLWEIPFKKEQQGWIGQILGGWQVNAIIPVQTGLPFTVFHTGGFPVGDFNADNKTGDRVNIPSFGNNFTSDPSTADFINGVFDRTDFPTPTLGTNGNLGRNTYEGPNFWTVDLSIFKNFRLPITEQSKIQFRAEFFNLFNNPNLDLASSASFPNLNSSFFGTITTDFDPRQIQFALKIIF